MSLLYIIHEDGPETLLTDVDRFEGVGQADDWHDIKNRTGAFSVPSYSSYGAKRALKLADGVADELFSWAAWPEGQNSMTTEVDASYLESLKQNSKSVYMMPVSPWFYTSKYYSLLLDGH